MIKWKLEGGFGVTSEIMKFMKLGSRPDTFYTTEAVRYLWTRIRVNSLFLFFLQVCGIEGWAHEWNFSGCRSVSSEVSSDLIVQVKGSRYMLHKVNYFSDWASLNESRAFCSKGDSGMSVILINFSSHAVSPALEVLAIAETLLGVAWVVAAPYCPTSGFPGRRWGIRAVRQVLLRDHHHSERL